MSSSYDDIYKLLVVGDASAGKTCMTLRFTDGNFTKFYNATIGVDFKFRNVKLTNGKTIKLQIWDTAGQERFRSISDMYYRDAMGVVFVYDITCVKSFRSIPEWVRTVRECSKPDVELILVGSKCDLNGKRRVPKKHAERLATQYGMKFMETSAKSNTNIDETFLTLARDIYDKREETQSRAGQSAKFVINDSASEQNSTGEEETGFIKLAWQSVKNGTEKLRTNCCQ